MNFLIFMQRHDYMLNYIKLIIIHRVREENLAFLILHYLSDFLIAGEGPPAFRWAELI